MTASLLILLGAILVIAGGMVGYKALRLAQYAWLAGMVLLVIGGVLAI